MRSMGVEMSAQSGRGIQKDGYKRNENIRKNEKINITIIT